MKNEFLLCGKVLNTHGIRGLLKVDPYCDTPEVFASLKTVYTKKGDTYVPHAVTRASRQGRFILLGLEDVLSIEAAFPYKNAELFASRADLPLPEDRVFVADIIGLSAIDADTGRVYGKIVDVEEAPASLLYVIQTENGTVLFPAVPAFISEIDTERGVFIRPIEGFFS